MPRLQSWSAVLSHPSLLDLFAECYLGSLSIPTPTPTRTPAVDFEKVSTFKERWGLNFEYRSRRYKNGEGVGKSSPKLNEGRDKQNKMI